MSEGESNRPVGGLLGGGARAARRIAGATGVDHVVDVGVEEAIVRALDSPAVERALIRLAEEGRLQGVLERVIAHADIEEIVLRALDSEASDRIWQEILASDKAQMLVERVAEAPEVRAAIAQQGFGLITDIGRNISRITEALDDVAERLACRLLGRSGHDAETNQAGLVTRLAAMGLDGALMFGVLSLVSGLLASIVPVAFGTSAGLSTGTAMTVAAVWFVIIGLYLTTFWTLAGQTPGMRFLGIRIQHAGQNEVGFRRSMRRLFAIPFSLLPFGLGFLAILTSPRRLALHDRIAETEVIYDEASAPWSAMPRGWAAGDLASTTKSGEA